MKQTKLSKKISRIFTICVELIKNLAEDTAINRFYNKTILPVVSIILFTIIIMKLYSHEIGLAIIFVLTPIIIVSLFLVKDAMVVIVFFVASIIEVINLSLNFLYLTVIGEIKISNYKYFKELKKDFIEAKKEIKLLFKK